MRKRVSPLAHGGVVLQQFEFIKVCMDIVAEILILLQ